MPPAIFYHKFRSFLEPAVHHTPYVEKPPLLIRSVDLHSQGASETPAPAPAPIPVSVAAPIPASGPAPGQADGRRVLDYDSELRKHGWKMEIPGDPFGLK